MDDTFGNGNTMVWINIFAVVTVRIDAKKYHQMKHNGKKVKNLFSKPHYYYDVHHFWILRYTYLTVYSSNFTVHYIAFQSKSKSDYLIHAIW